MSTGYTERFTEGFDLGGTQFPAVLTPALYTGAWLDMANYQRAALILIVGNMAATATLDAVVYEATSAAGANARPLYGKAITQLTDTDDNSVVVIEVRTEELDVDAGYQFITLYGTVANGNVTACFQPIRFVANYPPVPTTAIAEVVD